jgi:hypothetical protein
MKSGKILSAESFPKFSWFQGPQVLQIEGGYRLFFSTRQIDANKYYYSSVAYVDLNNEFELIPKSICSSVISRGELGTFDHDGIFPFHVFETRENRILGFICGWKRKMSVDIDMSIGISESHDGGNTFHRLGQGPILTANVNEPFLIGDPCVTLDAHGTYHMFYISGKDWLKSIEGTFERKYVVMHATSKNLFDWERDGSPILSNHISEEAQAMPTVVEIAGVFHMFYAFRNVFDFRSNSKNSYRLAHAYSNSLDGPWNVSAWSFPTESIEDWNDEMQCYPHAFIMNQNICLLYNGNAFGRFGIGILIIPIEEISGYAKF